MNEVKVEDAKVFENVDFGKLRVLQMWDQPWFLASEVANMLGYSGTNALTRRLRDKDKDNLPSFMIYAELKRLESNLSLTSDVTSLVRSELTSDIENNNIELTLITESGLYDAIFGSKKPEAQAFKWWVCDEVLPNIRKYGAHVQEKTLDDWLDEPELMIKTLTRLKEEKEARKLAEQEAREARLLVAEKEQVIECKNIKIQADAPKVEMYDRVISSESTYSISSIASTLGTSAIALNRYLKNHGIQYYKASRWHLYQKHANKGYTKDATTESNGQFKSYMRWTEAGREAIIRHWGLYN